LSRVRFSLGGFALKANGTHLDIGPRVRYAVWQRMSCDDCDRYGPIGIECGWPRGRQLTVVRNIDIKFFRAEMAPYPTVGLLA